MDVEQPPPAVDPRRRSSPGRAPTTLLPHALRRRLLPLVALSVVWVGAWAAIVWRGDGPVGPDRVVDQAILRLPAGVDGPATFVGDVAVPSHFAVLLVALVAVCLAGRSRQGALTAVIAITSGLGVVHVVKAVVGRHLGSGLSYPSGHVTVTTVGVTVLLLLLRPAGGLGTRLTRPARTLGAALCLLSVPVVAASMIRIRGHYFTDTIAAVPLGVSITFLVATTIDALVALAPDGSRSPRSAGPG